MSRIKQRIAELKSAGRKSLVPYLVAGDPSLEITVQLMHALVGAGADIIELGVPFSDPSSDGPVIQLAAERALRNNISLIDVFSMVANFRKRDADTPVVLMGYLNPIEIMGYENFITSAQTAGVDGVLVVDMPTMEAERFLNLAKPSSLDVIFLVAPTTTPDRARLICELCSGYLYYISLKGVTGADIKDKGSIEKNIQRLRQLTDLPIVIGFGIKDGAGAAEMASISDGVVVGSALVEKIAQLDEGKNYSPQQLQQCVSLIADIRRSIDSI